MTKIGLDLFLGKPSLTHLKRLTTKDGLVQHADQAVPDPSFGYSIDDNARALIVCLWHYRLYSDRSVLQLAEIYLNYLKRVEKEGGTFHNFLSFSEQLLDSEGSEDSIGRAIWALGVTSAFHPEEAARATATEIIDRANLAKHELHANVRAKAYIMLGKIAQGDLKSTDLWAQDLLNAYRTHSSNDWRWFEDDLRYANGILPYAMAAAYELTKNPDYLEIAIQSFAWLDSVSRVADTPSPIGQDGWYFKGKERALYDQQPLEAADMVLVADKLYKITKNDLYLEKALEWMSWYYGNNLLGALIYNEETRGIFDALTPRGVNSNQGAESIATFLLAYLALAENNG